MAYPPVDPKVLAALKRIQEDKARKPIVVSDPKDPRLKAYRDSLGLYKAYQMQDKLMGPGNKVLPNKVGKNDWTTKELKDRRVQTPSVWFDKSVHMVSDDFQSQKHQFTDDRTGKKAYTMSGDESDEKLINYYKKLGFTDKNIMYHSSPDVVSDKIRPIANYNDGRAMSPVYKKPEQPVVLQRNNGELRPDGAKKGKGFFGEIKRPDGKVSTELSIGVNLGGKEVIIPTMVPSLTQAEVSHLLSGKYNPSAWQGVDDVISRKAIDFARQRQAQKKPYFATPEEEGKFKPTPVPVPQVLQPMQPSLQLPVQPVPVPVKAPATNATPAPVPVSTWGPGPRYSIKDQRVRDMLKAIERMKK